MMMAYIYSLVSFIFLIVVIMQPTEKTHMGRGKKSKTSLPKQEIPVQKKEKAEVWTAS